MSTFDIDSFMQQTVVGANSTATIPVPVGEYLAISEDVKCIPWAKKDGSASGLKLQITWSIEDEAVKALLERTKVTVRQDIMLDLTEQNGLDMGKGKNVGLGRLREALDINDQTIPFSFPMIVGRMGKLAIVHEPYNDSILAQVKGVAKPA